MKRTINSFLLIIAIILIFSGCGTSKTGEQQAETGEVPVILLDSGTLFLEETLFLSDILISSDYLVAKIEQQDYNLQVFDREGNPLGYFVRKGKGPTELPTTVEMDHLEEEDGRTYVWLHDLNLDKLRKVDFTGSVEKGSTVIADNITYDMSLKMNTLVPIDENTIIGNTSNLSSKNYRLVKYHPKEDTLEKVVEPFPYIERRSEDNNYSMMYGMFYISRIKASPDLSRIASTMQYFNRLDVFDSNLELLHSYVEGPEVPKEYDNYLKFPITGDRPDVFWNSGYLTLETTQDYIFQVDKPDDVEVKLTEVNVYDWQARLLAKIHIPHLIGRVRVDIENEVLIGISFEGECYRFDLSGVLGKL